MATPPKKSLWRSCYAWLTSEEDHDMLLVLNAAKGATVDPDLLAAAYWRKFYSTYLPGSEWSATSKSRRVAIYRQRQKIVSSYAKFPPPLKDHVARLKPPQP